MRRWVGLAWLLVTACSHHGHTKHAASTQVTSCHFDVLLEQAGHARVTAACVASGPMAFRMSEPYLASSVHGPTQPKQLRFSSRDAKLSYDVDLAHLASLGRDFDRALKVGDSFMAPMSSVLLVPEPLTTEIPVTVTVQAPPGASAQVGLERAPAPNTYRLMAHEIPVATYFSFGKLRETALDVGSSKLEVSKLDAAFDEPDERFNQWIATSARAVKDFYGVFPVPRASITVLPVPAKRMVLFGKVLPESEPGVALVVGQHASHDELYGDWILVHELFHLGFPSFFEEGKWLDEGLATYYEPIIRVRAGLYTEAKLWDELESSMPQGVPAFTDVGLEQADDFRGIYWGGALACLIADIEARKRNLDRGLEVGLRALRDSGGNACEVWTLAEVIEAVDKALGAPTLAPIAAAHAKHGSAFDFKKLMRDLGVGRDAHGKLQLSEDAPLAAVRHAITARR